MSLKGPPIVIGWATKKHKVVYVLVIGLHQSHWLIHPGHCVARQSHWAAHRSYRVAHPIHLGGTPWSFDTGGYLWHLMLLLSIVTLPDVTFGIVTLPKLL